MTILVFIYRKIKETNVKKIEKMNIQGDKRLKSLSEEIATLRSLVKCPICLDTMLNPVRTKCGHSFCKHCLEIWISEKGSRGKVSCPSCQAAGITKRSLKDDVGLAQVVVQIR